MVALPPLLMLYDLFLRRFLAGPFFMPVLVHFVIVRTSLDPCKNLPLLLDPQFAEPLQGQQVIFMLGAAGIEEMPIR